MSTLSPRDCGPDALGRWQREGWRLTGRMLRAWGLPYLVLGMGGAWLLTQFSFLLLPYALLLVWLHGAAHALFVACGGRHAPVSAWSVVREDWQARKSYYLGEMVRVGAVLLVLLMVATVLVQLSDRPAPSAAALPLMWAMGLMWLGTSLVVFIARPLGMMSLHQDLGKDMGLAFSPSLQLAAQGWFRENMAAVTRVMPRLMLLPLVCLLTPFLLPVLELWWLAVLRCAYMDMFDQGKPVEEQVTAGETVAQAT